MRMAMASAMSLPGRRFLLPILIGAVLSGVVALAISSTGTLRERPAQEQPPPRREFTVVARRYAFAPARIEVSQGDLVRITLVTVRTDRLP